MELTFRKVTIFAGLDDDALSLLMSRARQTTVPAGDVIVRICKRFDRPDQVELARLNPGDFFGEMCILKTLPRAATVQATSETTLYALPSLAFYDLFQANPEQYSILILNIARDVSRRLRRLDEIFAALH